MRKYYVTMNVRVPVTLEEVYVVQADSLEQAEEAVLSGGGEPIDESILEYGQATSETVVGVSTSYEGEE